MITSLLALLGISMPSSDAQPFNLKTDTRAPDAREVRVLGGAICNTRKNCQVEDSLPYLPKQPGPFINRLIAVSVVYGSFTDRNRQEVLLTLCYPSSDACDGVSLLRKTDNTWKEIHYTKELAPKVPRDCLKFTGYDGRDRLTCHDSQINADVLYSVTAGARGISHKILFDGNVKGCDMRKMTEHRLWNWRKQDVNGDGRLDLVATFNRYDRRYTQPNCLDPERVKRQQVVRRWAM